MTRATAIGTLYEPKLAAKHTAILALPPPWRDDSPFARELAAEDKVHDSLGRAVHGYLGACQVHPTLPHDLADAAMRAARRGPQSPPTPFGPAAGGAGS